MTSFIQKSGRVWQITTGILLVACIGLLIALIVVATEKDKTKTEYVTLSSSGQPLRECGDTNPNGRVIDLTEPDSPGPFHDLTREEMIKLRRFLQSDPQIMANSMQEIMSLGFNSSYIFSADLWLAPKADILNYLDSGGSQPDRQAYVMMFRGDKSPPVVEEWICGPLPDVTSCDLLDFPNRRKPVEFESRPIGLIEFITINGLLAHVDSEIGHILTESYNATFTECEVCLSINPVPVASSLTGKLNERLYWYWAVYDMPYQLLHPVDFGMQFDLSGSDSGNWSVRLLWYHGQVFDTLQELKDAYAADTIEKSTMKKPVYSEELFSTLHRRGDYSPPNPQRPPTVVEPDGKRYSITGQKVEYLGWEFNFRNSPFAGPQLFDIRFQGERIMYELSLGEIAAFYSGDVPITQVTDYVDSGAFSGLGSKALVPGGDCPDTATLISSTIWNQHVDLPGQYDAAFCIFEINNGYPLRRHLNYGRFGGFYGGMLDSVLTLRSILTVGNYDYVVDFIFHQNGVLENRLMSTGYIQGNVYREVERRYGFRIQNTLTGNLHHHIFHLKADLDVGGVSNRYETLNVEREDTTLSWDRSKSYSQTKFSTHLKQTEQEALYNFDFDHPKYHLVYNEANKNKWGEKRAYRVHLSGMSKSLIPEGLYNERSIPWARHQIAVTKRKEEEFRSSSNYGMMDSLDPVVDFSTFYADNETIVDQDLVFWLTLGLHHIPHTEDLPVTPTAGNQRTAMFLPNNYFEQCPSMGSRDAIFINHKDSMDASQGVKVERNGNSRDQCILPKPTLEEDVDNNPDQVLESRRPIPSI